MIMSDLWDQIADIADLNKVHHAKNTFYNLILN